MKKMLTLVIVIASMLVCATTKTNAQSIGETDFKFTETTANNGAVTGTCTVVIDGTSFVPTLSAANVAFQNLPAGFTLVVTRTSPTVATLTIIGNAPAHTNINNISNMSFSFLGSAFTNPTFGCCNLSSTVFTGGTITFINPATITYSGNFVETPANNGAVSGSRMATLIGDTYTNSVPIGTNFVIGIHCIVTNVPAGLTAVMTRTSPTVATLTLTGNATTHLNAQDIANLTITWLDGAFTNTPNASNVTGYYNTAGTIDFNDQPFITYSGNFVETPPNNGAVSGSVTCTLFGDTFNFLTIGTNATVTGVPAGLTAVITLSAGNTVATLTLIGNAINNTNAFDVNNLTITFSNGAFTNTAVWNTTNSTNNGTPSFIDFNN